MVSLRRFFRRFCRTRAFAILAFSLVFCLYCGAEALFANRLRLEVTPFTEKTLDLSEAQLFGKATRVENGILLRSGGFVVFPGVQTEICDVSVSADAVRSEMFLPAATVKVSTRDDASAKDYRTYVQGRVYTDEPLYVRLRSAGNVHDLRIQHISGSDLLLTNVGVNVLPPFSFSVIRVLLLYGLTVFFWCILHFRWWKVIYCPHRIGHRRIIGGMLIACLLFLCFCGIASRLQEPDAIRQPCAYEQLFLSLKDGKVTLDIDFDASVLEELENPYDYTERSPAVVDKFGPFWDRAYYEGNFYCYFGIAPVLVIMFPVYFLTGLVPNMWLVSVILLVIGTFALLFAILQMLRYFRIHVPLLLLCLSFPALVFGALIPTIVICADMYYTAVAAGISFLCQMFFFAFAALNCRRPVLRRFLFAMSGLMLVLTVASRPTMALYAAVLIPPFIGVLLQKTRTRAEKWIDASSFLLPLLIGMIPVLYYNHIRFGSVLEFGATYQLTFHDISYNRLSLSLIGETLMHYFLQMPRLSGCFPYLNPSSLALDTYGVYFYSAVNIGAFAFPMTLAGFTQSFVTRKKPIKKACYLLLLLLPFVVAFCDLCLGGANIRYTADILLPLLLVGMLVLCELSAKKNASGDEHTAKHFFLLCFAIVAATFLLGFAFLFSNERNWVPAQLFRFFANIFS